eukprot:3922457-Rhodomonas_salina.2
MGRRRRRTDTFEEARVGRSPDKLALAMSLLPLASHQQGLGPCSVRHRLASTSLKIYIHQPSQHRQLATSQLTEWDFCSLVRALRFL